MYVWRCAVTDQLQIVMRTVGVEQQWICGIFSDWTAAKSVMFEDPFLTRVLILSLLCIVVYCNYFMIGHALRVVADCWKVTDMSLSVLFTEKYLC
jgi:hypothetical protein